MEQRALTTEELQDRYAALRLAEHTLACRETLFEDRVAERAVAHTATLGALLCAALASLATLAGAGAVGWQVAAVALVATGLVAWWRGR